MLLRSLGNASSRTPAYGSRGEHPVLVHYEQADRDQHDSYCLDALMRQVHAINGQPQQGKIEQVTQRVGDHVAAEGQMDQAAMAERPDSVGDKGQQHPRQVQQGHGGLVPHAYRSENQIADVEQKVGAQPNGDVAHELDPGGGVDHGHTALAWWRVINDC